MRWWVVGDRRRSLGFIRLKLVEDSRRTQSDIMLAQS
jgi:hypothetical protein